MNTLSNIAQQLNLIVILTKHNLSILSYILILLWSILGLDTLTRHKLIYLGIIPRRIYGLAGILFAPLLHANVSHLFFNSIPLVVLSNFLLFNGLHYFLHITLFITIISGFMIWCLAKPGLHIGASGVITGYWSLLICKSYQESTVISIILGFVCLYYFMGIFYAIFPSKKGVSWEGHLFGLLAGILVWYFKL